MPYRLRFDGVNDNVTIVSGINGNVGTQTYSYRVKGILNALPTVAGVTGAFAFIGTTATGQANGVCVYSTGAVNLVSGNTLRYGTSAGFLSAGAPFDFTLSHLNTGAWTITDNITSSVVASGTFTTSTSWSGALNNIGRFSSTITSYLNADIEFIEVTGHVNANKWDAGLSDGTGTVLPTTNGLNQGTLVNFAVPDCWVFYSTGASWEGTIGKTSLTVSNKQLFTALGYQTDVGLLDIFHTGKQQSVSAGYSNVLNKTTDDLSNKQLVLQAGAVLDLVKYTEDISYKQLEVQAGTSVSFTGLLNKQNYPVTYKQLSTQLGWSGSSQKQTLFLSSKQESVNAGFVVEQSKQSLVLNGEQLSVEAGSSISFVGTLSKQNYLLSQKALGSSLGAVVTVPKANLPVSFKPLSKLDTLSLTIGKSSLSLTGKALGLINGHLLEAQKRTLNLVTKQLSLGEIVYPIVPVERLFTIEHKNNIYIFKQNINVHIMKGK